MLRYVYIYYGILSPGWFTMRACTQRQNDLIVMWLKYWIVYALLQALMCITDSIYGERILYTIVKLVLSVCLWFSVPYSTDYMYTQIGQHFWDILRPIIIFGYQLAKFLLRLIAFFLQLTLASAPNDSDGRGDQKREPLVDGQQLQLELSKLPTGIEGDEAEMRHNVEPMVRQIVPGSSTDQVNALETPDQDSMKSIVEYLNNKLEYSQSSEQCISLTEEITN
nr:uncharacterized protein LOC108131498 [Drosophila bipectinata]